MYYTTDRELNDRGAAGGMCTLHKKLTNNKESFSLKK